MIPIIETNNWVMTISVMYTQDRDRRCRIVAIYNTCKRKLLYSKLVIPRQESKNEQENLMWFGPNLAYVNEERT